MIARITLAAVGTLLLIGGLLVWHEARQPVWTFPIAPVQVPFEIRRDFLVEQPFQVGLNATYQVDMEFRSPIAANKISSFDRDIRRVDLEWRIVSDGKQLYSDTTSRQPANSYSSFRADGTPVARGWVIGTFPARVGKKYVFHATVRGGPSDLNAAAPHLQVRVNTTTLTDYGYTEQFNELFRPAGLIAAGIGLLLVLAAITLQLARRRPAP
jgi:hypothetical protein